MNAPQADALRPYAERYAELGTGPLPTAPVTDPAYFEREREAIFRRVWLNLGREDEIPRPGDYMVKPVEVWNASIVLVRGDDGRVRAFHNVCRHRGNQVAEGCGNARGFSCGFHGWTYDTAGRLVAVPDGEQFFGLEVEQLGLVALPCETWSGFVFVHAMAEPPQGLAEFLAPLSEQLEGYPFGDMRCMHRVEADVNCNWKVFIDAFQESYHAAFVHRLSAAAAGNTDDDPYAHLMSVRLLGPHRSASVPFNPNYAPTPAEGLSFKYAQSIWLHDGSTQAAATPGCNPEGHDHWLFDINVVFPNFFVDVSSGWYLTYHFWPIAVDRTRWEYRFHMLPPQDAGEQISREYSKIYLRDLLREDLSTVERTQAGLASGAIREMYLSDQEVAVRHGYHMVEAYLRRHEQAAAQPRA